MTNKYNFLLILPLVGCTLDPNSIVAEDPTTARILGCKVDVPDFVDVAWDPPVVSAWPLGYNPSVKMLYNPGVSCSVETVESALQFWCDKLDICMSLEYVGSIPEQLEHGSVYVSVEQPPSATSAGQTFWTKEHTCKENQHARVYIKRCDESLLVHELGHAIGFMHSSNAHDVMFPTAPTSLENELYISPRSLAAYLVAQRAGKVDNK